LRALGVSLVAASADRPERLRETLAEHELGYTLVSDSSAAGMRAFGIAWRVPDDEFESLRGMGVDLEKASGEGHHLLPVPAVFLIDREGVIRYRYANPDFRVRLEPETLIEAAREFVSRAAG
jgi:peroxiredoxin